MELVKVILVIVTALRHTEKEMWQNSPICRKLDEPILYGLLSRFLSQNVGISKAANISLAALSVPSFTWSSSSVQLESNNNQIRGVKTGYVNKIECLCDNSPIVKCRLSGEFPVLKLTGQYCLSRVWNSKGTFELSLYKTSFLMELSAQIQKNNSEMIVENVGDNLLALEIESSTLVISSDSIMTNFANGYYENTINSIARDEAAKHIIVPIIEALIKPAFKIANSEDLAPLPSKPTQDNL